jgi:hypothetical protein
MPSGSPCCDSLDLCVCACCRHLVLGVDVCDCSACRDVRLAHRGCAGQISPGDIPRARAPSRPCAPGQGSDAYLRRDDVSCSVVLDACRALFKARDPLATRPASRCIIYRRDDNRLARPLRLCGLLLLFDDLDHGSLDHVPYITSDTCAITSDNRPCCILSHLVSRHSCSRLRFCSML